MKQVRILPYKPGSRAAKALARAVNGLRVRFAGKFRPRWRHMVINWGSSQTPSWWTSGMNPPAAVARSGNKLSALTAMKAAGVSVPDFTTDAAEAKKWFDADKIVVGRRILNGSQGHGIELFAKDEDFTRPEDPNGCPLYTQHLRHKREYRVHVFNGRVIDMVEKRRRKGVEGRNPWVRNHDNGYVFCRDGLAVPEVVRTEAIAAVRALGLDFGAADVAFREKENRAFVFEVNSAPGLEGTTVQSYAKAVTEAASR